MNFLFPNVLWGTLLIAIPIIVHLFNLRRAKKVYFSNVQFLSKIKSSSSSKLVLKHYLSLAARILFIVFLVLAFAQPYLGDKVMKGSGNNGVTLYFDNSLSNSNLYDANVTCFEKNYASIVSMIEESGISDKFRLITNDPYSKGMAPLVRDKLMEKLSETSLSSKRKTFDELKLNLESAGTGNNIYFFSDFQNNQFKLDEFSDTSNQYYFVPTQYFSNKNVYVDSLYLDNIQVDDTRSNSLNIIFRNSGLEDVIDISSSLVSNGVQLSTNSIDIPAKSKRELRIDLSGISDSVNLCEIVFDDYPTTFDNRFYFVIKKSQPLKVLEIRGTDSNSYFEAVYGGDLFQYSASVLSNVDYSSFADSDIILLNELTLDDKNLVTQLTSYIQNGGTVFVVPHSESINLSSYENLIGTDLRLTEQLPLVVKNPDVKDPFFSGIFDSNPRESLMPTSSASLTWRGGRDILSFVNSTPFLSEFDVQAGKVFLLAENLSGNVSDFPSNALFLPVMYNIAFRSTERKLFELYNRMDDESIVFKLDDLAGNNSIYKLKSGERELVPSQRVIDKRLYLNLQEMEIEPGFWELYQNDLLIDAMALNFAKLESDIDQVSTAELENLVSRFPNLSILNRSNPEDTINSLFDSSGQKNLWKYSLILSLLFFFAEVIILRFL